MICNKCGRKVEENSQYCNSCGNKIENLNNNSNIFDSNAFNVNNNNQSTLNNGIAVNNDINNGLKSQENINMQYSGQVNNQSNINGNILDANVSNNAVNDSTNKYLETAFSQDNKNSNINNISMQSQMNSSVYNQAANQINPQQNNTNINEKDEADKKTKISFIIGIVSIILSFLLNLFVISLSIIGLVLGIKSKDKSKKKTIGIILNISSMVIAIIVLIIGSFTLNLSDKTSTYYGSGYELKYDKNWIITELSSGQEALRYKRQNSYLIPIGKSTLTQYTNNLNCDFDESSCKERLYDKFYDYWSTNMPSNSLYLYKETNLFMPLKDDVYYATYDYGTSKDNITGKNYLIVSKEKDIILSFMSNAEAKNVKMLDKKIIKLFEQININDNSNVNVIEDDELGGVLDSMSNWNRYSELRSGSLAKKANINGGWRILGDSEQYWEFKDGKFWWYKSVNDLNDNYWYGTTKIVTGLEGLKLVGLGEDNLKNVLSNANGKISQNDVYAVICTPTKIISDGEDKSSTNIPNDTKWKYVWIVIDHGSEGIEGQVLDMTSGYETSYFVKLKD